MGIGLLLMIVMGMGGIDRGLIHEATLLVDQIGADFWVVQGSARGPFAEVSRVPAKLEDRVLVVTHDHRSLDVLDTTYEMEDGRLQPS